MTHALITAPTLAFVLSTVGVALLRRWVGALPPDVPNARSLHARPVPRAGGYAIWLGFLPAALAFAPAFPGGLAGWLPPFVALAVVSGFDDARQVGVVVRLSVHAAAAAWAAGFIVHGQGMGMPGALFAAAVVALAIAWSSNLYNFMDGTDGLAATMGAVGFVAYGIAALGAVPDDGAGARGAPAFFALAAAILPFLAVNRPRATMFLGDIGAVPLGYLAAAFGVAGVAERLWPAWFPMLVFLPFIADATLTLVRRIARRERLWEGHRNHYYQRLALLGAGHRGTLAVYATLIAASAVTATLCRAASPDAGWWALAASCMVLVMLFAAIDYHWCKKTGIPSPR
jgi:UDP-N-acetylmuramyl pentapeptide phosphotransferase/UDP-N-acetylglucosamine-1-phosphate transferase